MTRAPLWLLLLAATGAYADPALDAPGRAMLDSLREQALRPAELVARLRPALNAVIVDVGAGPGFLTLPLGRAVPHGRVIATDLRGDYLAVAAARAAGAGLRNVETRVVGPEDPGLAPGSVDLIVVCQVDHHLRDRAGYLAALGRALRPGGRIALVNYERYREPDLAAARAANLRLVDAWRPSPPFFALVLARQ